MRSDFVSGQLSVVSCAGASMARTAFEKLNVYRVSERIADDIWDIVMNWDSFARNAVGMQLVRAADSIGANIAEGSGRGSYRENRRFVRIARGSLNETQHFLRRAYRRKLLTSEQIERLRVHVDELGPRLNAYLKSIGPVEHKRK
jgi:four helix bundle protein